MLLWQEHGVRGEAAHDSAHADPHPAVDPNAALDPHGGHGAHDPHAEHPPHAAADGHTGQAADHGGHAEEATGSKVPELPNLLGQIHHILHGTPATHEAVGKFDKTVASWGFADPLGTPVTALENIAFAYLYIALLCAFFISGYKRLKKSPKEGSLSRRAMLLEIVVLYFDDFFGAILGKGEGRKHLAFVGTLFMYIFVCNTAGLIWMGKAPTANLSFNAGLALLVFFYVHITGISRSPKGYLMHFPGSLPSIKEIGPIGYFIVPFMAVLFTIIHILEVFIQPLSLCLRLYGNVLGKDVLLGVFAGLLAFIPLHTPFLFLGLLLGTIQALIFSLLTSVYISMWLPHEHAHDDEHDHAHDAHAESHAH
jgi:F-type H+-transporting ATPase subunit a